MAITPPWRSALTKKKPVLKSRVLGSSVVGGSKVKLGGSRAPRAPGVKTSPTPVAPVQETGPKPIAVQPITLPGGTASRATAAEQLGGALATGNRGLHDLAQQLGGLSSISQYNWAQPVDDPNTPENEAIRGFGSIGASDLAIDPNDPNSTMAVIARNLGKNLQFVGDTAGNRNTWQGGLRLTEEKEQRDSADNLRAKAMQDYNKARLDLVDQLMGGNGAFGAYKGIIRDANAADDVATAAAIAEAQAQADATPPPAAAAAAPGETGAQVAARQAAAHGGAAKVTQGVYGNWWGEWHTYPDGRRVFVKKMPWGAS